MDMYCEYCEIDLFDPADVRRHILTMSHFRNKNMYELNMNKYFERKRQAKMHPDNFEKLCLVLNMHSEKDVIALDKAGFFKNEGSKERLWHYNVYEELLKVLMDSGIRYHLAQLHPQVRKQLLRLLEEEKTPKETPMDSS